MKMWYTYIFLLNLDSNDGNKLELNKFRNSYNEIFSFYGKSGNWMKYLKSWDLRD